MANVTKGKTFRLLESDLDAFERLYPDLLPLFVQRAVHCAVCSKSIFENIFFNDFITSGLSIK